MTHIYTYTYTHTFRWCARQGAALNVGHSILATDDRVRADVDLWCVHGALHALTHAYTLSREYTHTLKNTRRVLRHSLIVNAHSTSSLHPHSIPRNTRPGGKAVQNLLLHPVLDSEGGSHANTHTHIHTQTHPSMSVHR